MKLQLRLRKKGTAVEWDETVDAPVDQIGRAKAWAKAAVAAHNDWLKYLGSDDYLRELVNVSEAKKQKKASEIVAHDWVFVRRVRKRGERFDEMQCQRCGTKGERHVSKGISYILLAPKYRKMEYARCSTALEAKKPKKSLQRVRLKQ